MYCQYWLFVHKYVKSYSKIQPTTEQNPQTYSKVIMKYYYIHVSCMSHSHSLLRPVAKHMPMDTSLNSSSWAELVWLMRIGKLLLPSNSLPLESIKCPTSILPVQAKSDLICMFRVRSPTSAAKRMRLPSSVS